MSVQGEIDRIAQNVANTYAVLGALGADLPEEKNSDNLSATAGSTKVLLFSEQRLSEKQQAQARENIGAVSDENIKDDGSDEVIVEDSNHNAILRVGKAGLETTALILNSSTRGSNKRFMITVDDNGMLRATEYTGEPRLFSGDLYSAEV